MDRAGRDVGWTVEGLFVKRVGRGPRVVLLHGGVLAGELCWRRQLPLADHFTLEIADRAGYGRSQQISPGEDLDADAPLVAASMRPGAVLSLTLCEPVAFQLAPRSAAAQQMARDTDEHLQRPGADAPWLRGFLAIVGRDVVVPDQLPPPLAQGVRAIRAVRRRPWEGELPVDQLAAALIPKLVISGDHSVRASQHDHPDLFWAIRGGGGNFGIVTEFEFGLRTTGTQVLAGPIFHPAARAREVLRFYRASGRPAVRSCRSAATAPGSGCHDTVNTPPMSISTPLMCMR